VLGSQRRAKTLGPGGDDLAGAVDDDVGVEISRKRSASEGARAALDVMLTDAAVGGRSRFVRPGAAVGVVAGLARRPGRPVRRFGGLGAELARVAAGRSDARPAKRDRRFADPAWASSWLFRRLLQTHLAVGEAVDGLISDAELDWRHERQARFAAGNVLDALAPSNFPWSNPAVIKETVDQGGRNLVRGAQRFAADFPRLPSTVDTSRFAVGENLALTPGSVVLRTDVFELIQYAPRTEQVREVPLLFAPPTINKYYVLDLAPGRSMVEWLVEQGQQVFMISWRNPDAEQGHFDLDTYAAAVLEARDAVAAITGQQAVHLTGACSGGIISAGVLGHLAAEGRLGEIASLTLLVVALDNERAGTASALAGREVAAAAIAESARRGYLDGRALSGVFTWLRPNDLVWSYVVNNYLLGKDPPAFDVLFWNQDTVRLAAGLHRDFIRLSLENSLTLPGALEVLGSSVELGAVDVDSYVVAGLTDHIIPWENAYRSTQLLGGTPRFVLSTSGHIQALVNPPAHESRATYRVADEHPEAPTDWEEKAVTRRGSWWPDYDGWLAARSGSLKPAPKRLGGRGYKATAKAPGSYVHAR
jgi:polyhydroxyalkanoate synthase subunit PhaC